MKRIFILTGIVLCALSSMARTSDGFKKMTDTLPPAVDSTITDSNYNSHDHAWHPKDWRNFHHWQEMHHKPYKPSNLSTNWLIVDLGFANYNDKTNYNSPGAQTFAPGAAENWFHLKTQKSVNVNIWIFMQRLNMIKHVLNLKYGLGVELNNYRYRDPIVYQTDPTLVVRSPQLDFKKNKLAADYVTVPMMLNFNFTPNREEGFGLSFGASAGYLYSARQKTIISGEGKHKEHDDFDMEPFKVSWIAELLLGPVKLYGSLATKSMFGRGLDQTPYTIGIRLSKW